MLITASNVKMLTPLHATYVKLPIWWMRNISVRYARIAVQTVEMMTRGCITAMNA